MAQNPMSFGLDKLELPFLERPTVATHRVPRVVFPNDGLLLSTIVDLVPSGMSFRQTNGKAETVLVLHHFSIAISLKILVSLRGFEPPLFRTRFGAAERIRTSTE